jgi:RNA polymerase sigma factor (sigma-70 family)
MTIAPEILQGCIANDAKCQEALYKHYYAYVLSICMRYYNSIDESRAALNGVFFKVFNKINFYKKEQPFEVWMRRVAINTLIDEYRKNKKHLLNTVHKSNDMWYTNDEADSSDLLETKLAYDQLNELLNSVPEVSRRVFNLFVVDGYSHREISEMLSMSEGTSKWHVNNARKILKEKAKIYLSQQQILAHAK